MNMGEQETLITVALPEATRANSADSALGGLDNKVLDNYDLRFILEIYQGEKCYRMESIGQETEATFPVRVVQGHEYDFVVWADFVKKGAKVDDDTIDDLYYNTESGLDEITIRNNAAMTEARDAYYGVAHLDADKAVSTISNITLTRPFAKVRVVTTDLSDCIEQLGLQPQTATVTYKTETYDKFDARNKNVWSVRNDDNEKFVEYDKSVYGEDNLFVDYILVPQGTQSTVKFDLNVTNVINRSFNTDIAVEANKLTTIKGNILTNGSDIKVDVNDDFVSETIYLEGDVTLTEDLVIDRPMVVRDNATAVLNLNGHKIINTTGTADYESEGIIVYGNLTINDETGKGLIEANSRAIWARGNYGATITINGGNYVGAHLNTEVIYASGNGQIEINGGTFEAKEVSTGHGSATNRQHIILNLHNNGKDGCNIVVKGGSYKNFDPANNIAENPAKNFCADGYVSVANGEWFDVVKGATVASVEDLQKVIENAQAGDTITIASDITLTEAVTIPAGVIFNGNGKQINGELVAGGDVTFIGHTKVTSFSASYYNRTITIEEDACLEITGTGRVSLAYGNTFDIKGNIENAKSADKANIQPSLIIPGGISITGGNDAVFNIKNTYVKIGSTSSKNNAANGTFTINIENSIAEFTNQLTFAEPTGGKNPTFNLNVKNSVLTTATKLILAAPNCNMVVDNSTIDVKTYFRNSGILTLNNGSVLTGATTQFGENGGHDGKTVVDASTLTIEASSTGHAFDGKGTGSIKAQNGATVAVDYYKDMTIEVDATSTFTGTKVF